MQQRTKRSNKPRNRFQEFTARKLPRGVHFTIYDIQGNNISDELVKKLEEVVERTVLTSGVKSLGIDVRKG